MWLVLWFNRAISSHKMIGIRTSYWVQNANKPGEINKIWQPLWYLWNYCWSHENKPYKMTRKPFKVHMITSNWWKKQQTHIEAAYWRYTNKWSIQSADIFIDWIVLFKRDQYIETTSNPFHSTYVSVL